MPASRTGPPAERGGPDGPRRMLLPAGRPGSAPRARRAGGTLHAATRPASGHRAQQKGRGKQTARVQRSLVVAPTYDGLRPVRSRSHSGSNGCADTRSGLGRERAKARRDGSVGPEAGRTGSGPGTQVPVLAGGLGRRLLAGAPRVSRSASAGDASRRRRGRNRRGPSDRETGRDFFPCMNASVGTLLDEVVSRLLPAAESSCVESSCVEVYLCRSVPASRRTCTET